MKQKIAKLHYITDSTDNLKPLLDNGLNWVQLRIKNKSEDEVKVETEKLLALTQDYLTTVVLNDYVSVAKNLPVHGLHLGLSDEKISVAKKEMPSKKIVGGTSNTIKDILYQIEQGCDYLGTGPFRFTKTKEKLSPILGLEGYKKIMTAYQLHQLTTPIIAIGGIQLADIEPLLNIGIHGVAVSSLIKEHPNPVQQLKEIQLILNDN